MRPVARHDNLLTQEVGNELVIYDQARHRVHRLNETAARIWRGCDGKTSVADLATRLPQSESSEDVVWMALEKLGKAKLLEARVEAPAAVRDQSRRDWMRRAALAGGAVALLPVISSMTAPTPVMADSGNGGDDDNTIEVVAAGAAVAAVAASGDSGGGTSGDSNNDKGDEVIPCAQRVPGASGGGCTGAPCGPGLRCLPSLTDPTKCVCR
jgi:hypothetical protein